MKLAVIGGGGVRSMFLAKSIAAKAEKLGITELCFMDTDEVKLNIFGKMAGKVSEMIAPELKFTLTSNSIEAVTDADYVITTIRVGGDSMRVRDERIALGMGLLGQETTGAAGFSFAMRSIPALLGYCEDIKRYAKSNVKVFNFTNPAGLVSQALSDKGYNFTFGICDAPSGMLHSFADLLGVASDRVYGDIYGLNHLSFFNKITLDGEDIIEKLIDNDEAYNQTDMRYFSKSMLQERHFIPNEYLYYFFNREKAVANILNSDKTRGEQIEEINKMMIDELLNVDIENDFDTALEIFEKYYGMRENSYMSSETGVSRQKQWKFDPFSEDDGGYAGVALRYIEIVNRGKSGEMIFCTKNNGAIPNLENDDIVEITCEVSKNEIVPHKFELNNLDSYAMELIRRMKLYERKSAASILAHDKSAAIEAMALHPLVESYSLAEQLIENYIELNKDYSFGWK
ncbi:MAG: 6-phospho-beta-glucosidase [Clostridia bacterium]|nr:6-phospho-beta-glucosidase [Clostridia bacterium]